MRVNSSGDMLGLIAELNSRRIAMITGKMAKRQGGQLQLPKKTLNLLQTARRLHHRYSAGEVFGFFGTEIQELSGRSRSTGQTGLPPSHWMFLP